MAIHFLQSKAAKSLSLAQVFRMTESEAETAFRKIRWSETDGEAVSGIPNFPWEIGRLENGL